MEPGDKTLLQTLDPDAPVCGVTRPGPSRTWSTLPRTGRQRGPEGGGPDSLCVSRPPHPLPEKVSTQGEEGQGDGRGSGTRQGRRGRGRDRSPTCPSDPSVPSPSAVPVRERERGGSGRSHPLGVLVEVVCEWEVVETPFLSFSPVPVGERGGATTGADPGPPRDVPAVPGTRAPTPEHGEGSGQRRATWESTGRSDRDR